MALPMVGSTYPTVTGENTPKGAAFVRIIDELPGLELWSVYYDGSDLPSWNEEWFKPQYDHIRYYIISMKTSDVNAVGGRMVTMPEHLHGRVIVILHHEPDQWRSVEDPRGDPHPDVWWARQQAFLNLRDNAMWRDWVKFAVCFTEDRARMARAVWDSNWGNRVLSEVRIDFVMFDCFNIGRSIVRVGSDIFGIPISYGEQFQDHTGKMYPCVMIREYGQVTPVDQPTDTTQVATGIAENWDYLANSTGGVIGGVVWYYNHNNTLADPTTIRRPLTLGVVQGMLEDAIEDHESSTEYDQGYADGRASRQSEIDGLQSQVDALTIALPKQKAAGRLEAFGEVVNWATQQV